MNTPESEHTDDSKDQTTVTSGRTSFFSAYWRNSKNPLFSYILCLPLLLIYELLIYATQPESGYAVRISADVWIKSLYFYLGYNTVSVTLLVVAVFGIFLFISQRRSGTRLNFRHLGTMLIEASGWALILAWLISGLTGYLLGLQATAGSIAQLSLLDEFALSLGAGLYEELFFRLFLVWAGFQIFKRIFNANWMAYSAAALISAFLFSLAHFTGQMGDLFTINAFLYRMLFGLALNALFVIRGFGITAWAHAIYDLLVIFYFT